MADIDSFLIINKICLILPKIGWVSVGIAALFGFFDRRDGGVYVFRFRRFFACIGGLFALSLLTAAADNIVAR